MLGKALAITSLVVAMVTGSAEQAAAAAPVSTIRSTTQSTCLDAATTNPGGDMAGQKCTATTSQSFAFHPISGAAAGTYQITSQSSGSCLDQYRFGIRQASCTGSVPPDASNTEWTLTRLGSSGNRYHFVVTTTVGTPSPRCVQVYPAPPGYVRPRFAISPWNSNEPSQILTLSTAPWLADIQG